MDFFFMALILFLVNEFRVSQRLRALSERRGGAWRSVRRLSDSSSASGHEVSAAATVLFVAVSFSNSYGVFGFGLRVY